MKPRAPEIIFHGPIAEHDQECAVMPGEPAIYNCNTGIFEPSWAAQENGWNLIQAKTLAQRLALKMFFNTQYKGEGK